MALSVIILKTVTQCKSRGMTKVSLIANFISIAVELQFIDKKRKVCGVVQLDRNRNILVQTKTSPRTGDV